MRKLFKKALACCLVAALALTCFVGALSVSAETAAALTGKIEVGTVEVADDATTATVPVVITSDNALNAAKITVAASEGWEVSAIAIDAASTAAKIEPENINGDTFIVEALDNIAGFTTATVNVTFTSKVAVAATITATLDPVHAATWNEDVVNLAVTDGAITVKAAEPECDHADAEIVYSVDENNACITKKVCSCGNEEVIATIASEGADYTGVAVYKAPVLASGLAINFRIKQSSVSAYSDVYGVFSKDTYEGNTLSAPIDVTITPIVDNYAAYWTFAYTGISAKEMCNNIGIKIYGTDANGNVVLLSVHNYAFVDYLESNYKKYESATGKNAALRDLLVDLAVYGAYAQDYFSYHLDVKPTANIPLTYASELPTTFDTTEVSTGITIYKAPTLGNAITVDMRVKKTDVSSYGEDLAMVIKYKTTSGENKTMTVPYADFGTYGSSYWSVTFDKITAATVSNVYTTEIVKVSDNTVIGSLDYTLEKYAHNRYNGDDNGKPICYLCQAMIAYGYSADAYLNYGA